MPGNTTKRYPAELKAARAVRMVEQRPEDETEWSVLVNEIRRVHADNYGVYGARCTGHGRSG